MASSSDNLAAYVEPWLFRPPAAFVDSWVSESFLRDTEEMVTKALQKSISDTPLFQSPLTEETAVAKAAMLTVDISNSYSNVNYLNSNSNTTSVSDIAATVVVKEDTPPLSGGSGSSDPGPTASKGSIRSLAATGLQKGKAMKRKTRPSKRSPTTFITADPANFRQMVQQVTGAKYLKGEITVASVLKPEPKRLGSAAGGAGVGGGSYVNPLQGCLLPTLDTSAFLLDSHHHQQVLDPTAVAGPSSSAGMSFTPPGTVSGGAVPSIDFENFFSFPTLESGKVL
ncbi:hypothetical protein Ancab_013953 [Ancistrocladus abbreviatus]